MRILMMTNIYVPYVGGVERSIESFAERFRRQGHSVLIIAPKTDQPVNEDPTNVFRVSAIKNFNDTNFPVTIPLPGALVSRLEEFQPEIVHSHFPFIIGSAAVRVAASYEIPLVFTYHTMYERYIHYIHSDSEHVRTFVKSLAAGYANLCDLVIAPSRAVEKLLRHRGVAVPIEVIPTGVDAQTFATGDGGGTRRKYHIRPECFVAGYVSRLTSEKNLVFLQDAMARLLKKHKDTRFLIVGDGLRRQAMEDFFFENDLSEQVVFTGMLDGQALVDAYHAMDVFVFTSKSETQGMVLAEAMAAGLPVVALEASGVTDILQDGENGYMVRQEDAALFADRLDACYNCEKKMWESMKQKALQTSAHFSIDACAGRVLENYQRMIQHNGYFREKDETLLQTAMDLIKAEWDIFRNYMNAAGEMLSSNESHRK
jgi:1,2-diacylglycerol 3-alpha-glucosyltransferase